MSCRGNQGREAPIGGNASTFAQFGPAGIAGLRHKIEASDVKTPDRAIGEVMGTEKIGISCFLPTVFAAYSRFAIWTLASANRF
jgi:hypothetical protein